MAFGDNLDKAIQDWVYLLEIEVGHRIDEDTWTQDGTYTNCWYITHNEGLPSKVEEDGGEMTERATLTLCNSNAGSWYFDSSNNRLYLHVADSGDPGDGGQIILSFFWELFCNKQPEGTPIVFSIDSVDRYYLPYIDDDDIPAIHFEVTGFEEGGFRQSFGSVRLINADGHFDTRLTDYIYEAKRLFWKVGKAGDTYSNYATLWLGWTGSIIWEDEAIEIAIEDMRKYFYA